MKSSAFSLIELMIVIAIVALLSAMALPVYKDYVIKSKLSAVASSLDSVIQAEKAYYNRYGRFANATELGYVSADNQGVFMPDIAAVNPYLQSAAFGSSATTCTDGRSIDLTFRIKDEYSGFDPGANFGVYYYLADINGAIVVGCQDESGGTYMTPCARNDYAQMQTDAGC